MIEEELTYKIRGAIFAVYKELGLGLLVNFNTVPPIKRHFSSERYFYQSYFL